MKLLYYTLKVASVNSVKLEENSDDLRCDHIWKCLIPARGRSPRTCVNMHNLGGQRQSYHSIGVNLYTHTYIYTHKNTFQCT